MLIEEINVLKNKKVKLDKQIFVFDSRNKEITDQIEEIETKIKNLENQKKAKKFQWFSNFNKKITKLMIKIKVLKADLDENEKNMQPLKILKLNILKNIIKLQNDLYQEEVKNNQEIFQKLDEIAENPRFKGVDELTYPSVKNPFDEVDSDTERSDILRATLDELENKILIFEKKSEEIAIQIQTFENNIDVLREEKTETNWKITCLNIITFGIFKYHRNKKFNKQIKALQLKAKTLSEESSKNEKNTRPLMNLKLNTLEDIIELQDSIFIKLKMEKEEEITQRLTAIVENKSVAEFDETNPFAIKSTPMLRYSSKDSGIGSEKQANIVADSLNPFDENDNENSSSSLVSSCSEVVPNYSEQNYIKPLAAL